ncbi:hypothetical protein O7600_16220 [Micromonospora sp. WMMA1998]|uniref:hypothetical protein n=1 Tax=Micromonospora sp. WMMA1998 TaxID=3015167 RepID=UPI00248C8AAF|nr:hypothetical protein [Micromonospora sp. WMMA1998]WBC12729.1 hypothetical protein O7600_16220 [Micromonospora sp. WMMA1998]
MSDLPPSGSTEPMPPASSGAPTDPTRSTPPTAGPVPGQPDPSGSPTPAADPWARPVVPEQPGPGASQPAHPDPATPATPAPGWPASSGATPAPGWPASSGATPAPGWPASSGATPAPGWPAPPGDPSTGWGWPSGGPAYPGHPMPGAPYPAQPMPGGHYGWYPPTDPNDPLVTPPHAGVAGWFSRCAGAARRGWRQLLPIMLLTQCVPAAIISVLSLYLVPTDEPVTGPDGAPVLPDGYLEQFFAFYGVVMLAALIFGPVQAAGWGAGTWVVARQAAGEAAGLGAALRYGLRRALGLWGWTIVASLLITVGACLCLLPGVYVGFAVALFGPVYLFERQDPIGRAWRMFHQRFGMVLGRVALVMCALLAATVLDLVVSTVSGVVFGADPTSAPGTTVGAVALAVVGAALAAPAYLAQLVGLVVAYAEQRAQEGPVNAARLAAELG